jgi:hypothetical protein
MRAGPAIRSELNYVPFTVFSPIDGHAVTMMTVSKTVQNLVTGEFTTDLN